MAQIQMCYCRGEDRIFYAFNSLQQYTEYDNTNETRKVSEHSDHIKIFLPREKPPSPLFDKLGNLLWVKKSHCPHQHRDQTLPRIDFYIVDKVVTHRCSPRSIVAHNYKCRLRLQGYGLESDIEHRADEVPQCHELIAAYRTVTGLNNQTYHNEPVQ